MPQYNSEILLHQPSILTQLQDIAASVVPDNETIFILLKGAFKEYLICTDKNLYIVKQGFMTGHTFGNGNFKMPYRNITNVEVNYGFGGGYFEVSAGGMQNTEKNYWSTDKSKDPAKQPNTISINSKELRDGFGTASNMILEKINEAHNPTPATAPQPSPANELREFKKLLDDGLITEEEFNKKKKQILGI